MSDTTAPLCDLSDGEFILIARKLGEIERLKADRTATDKKIEELEKELGVLGESVYQWARANRSHLEWTDGFISTGNARFGWKDTVRAVCTEPLEKLVTRLRRLRLMKFVRIKIELDKEMMRKDPKNLARVKTLALRGGSLFQIRPEGRGDFIERQPGKPEWKHRYPSNRALPRTTTPSTKAA